MYNASDDITDNLCVPDYAITCASMLFRRLD